MGTRVKGYSLLEIMLAISLIGLLALGLVVLAGAALRMNRAGHERIVATELGTELMERIRANGYLLIPDDASLFDGRTPDSSKDGFPPAPYPRSDKAPGHTLMVETEQLRPNLRRVKVTVFAPTSATRLESYFHP